MVDIIYSEFEDAFVFHFEVQHFGLLRCLRIHFPRGGERWGAWVNPCLGNRFLLLQFTNWIVEALSTVGSNTGQNAAKSICVPFQSHCISFPALRDCTPVLSLCLQWRWRHYHAIQASSLSLSCLSTEEMRASQLLASCKGIHLFPMVSITLADVLGKESCRFLCLLTWLLRYCCRVSIGLVCMGTVLVCSPTSPFFLPGSHYFQIPGVDLSVIQIWEELSWTLVKVCYSLELWIARDSLRNP